MDIQCGKKKLIALIDCYIADQMKKEHLIRLVETHPSVPVRGIFEEIIASPKMLTNDDRNLLDDLMHFYG
jgi:hypothetical protein